MANPKIFKPILISSPPLHIKDLLYPLLVTAFVPPEKENNFGLIVNYVRKHEMMIKSAMTGAQNASPMTAAVLGGFAAMKLSTGLDDTLAPGLRFAAAATAVGIAVVAESNKQSALTSYFRESTIQAFKD